MSLESFVEERISCCCRDPKRGPSIPLLVAISTETSRPYIITNNGAIINDELRTSDVAFNGTLGSACPVQNSNCALTIAVYRYKPAIENLFLNFSVF